MVANSLVEKYYSLLFTNFQGDNLVNIQLVSNDRQLPKTVEIPSLKQETSTNGSIGFTYNSKKFTATLTENFNNWDFLIDKFSQELILNSKFIHFMIKKR